MVVEVSGRASCIHFDAWHRYLPARSCGSRDTSCSTAAPRWPRSHPRRACRMHRSVTGRSCTTRSTFPTFAGRVRSSSPARSSVVPASAACASCPAGPAARAGDRARRPTSPAGTTRPAADACRCRRGRPDSPRAGRLPHDRPMAAVKFGRLGACRRLPDRVVEYRCGENSRIVAGMTGRPSILDPFRPGPPATAGKQR